MNAKDGMEYKLKRIGLGLKQKDIAQKLKCSATLISLFENGKRDLPKRLEQNYKRFFSED